MKRILAMICLVYATNPAQAELIAGWNFNSQSSGVAPTPILADHGSGSLDLSKLAVTSDANIGSTTSGTSVNKVGGDVNGNDFYVQAGSGEIENGKSIVFSMSLSGYKNLVLTYATDGTGTGFTSQQWSYGTDGINYTSFGSTITPTTSFTTGTIDFSSVTALDNDSTVYFELTFSGASGSAAGSDHFDNFQFNAIPIPEPAAWGLISALGLLIVGGGGNWRSRRTGMASVG